MKNHSSKTIRLSKTVIIIVANVEVYSNYFISSLLDELNSFLGNISVVYASALGHIVMHKRNKEKIIKKQKKSMTSSKKKPKSQKCNRVHIFVFKFILS